MEALTIETFKPDKIKAISVDERVYGETNYTSVKPLTDCQPDIKTMMCSTHTSLSF